MYICGSIMFKQILFFSLKVYVYIYFIMSLYEYIVNMLPASWMMDAIYARYI